MSKDGLEAVEIVSVDLTEADPKKAVTRSVQQPDLPESEDADTKVPSWLEQKKEWNKRVGRLKRQFSQQRADDQAEFQRQLSDRDDRIKALEARKQESPASEADHEREMSALQDQLEAAQEKGDSKEVGRLTRVMAQKEAAYWNRKTQSSLHEEEPGKKKQTEKKAATSAEGQPTAAGQKWINANGDWWDDEDFEVERAAAAVIHKRLMADGSDPESEEHYQEVASQLRERFPDLPIEGLKKQAKKKAAVEDDLEGSDELVEEGRRAPALGVRRGVEVKKRAGSMQLTSSQIATMRAVGLDPTNPKHVLTFAQEAQQIERESRT